MPSLAHKQRLLTVDEYHTMARAGILTEDDRVELIDGKIITMSPVGSLHAACVNRITHLFAQCTAGRAIISVQNPIQLADVQEPQPDVALLHPRADFYASQHPGPTDVLLLVEVAGTSLDYDRTIKMPRYAAAGIPEVWIVALGEEHVEVYRRPTAQGYATRTVVSRGDVLTVEALPELGHLAVTDVLGR